MDAYGCMDVSGCCFLLVILFGEFFFVPGVVAEGGVGDAAGFEGGAAEIRRGGLQGIEEESGGAVVDLIGQEEAHALHEGYLDRVRVFQDRQI